RALREQVLAQLGLEGVIVATDPLEHHRRVLLLFLTVVQQDRAQRAVVSGIRALAVPVDRLELLHQAHERPMHVPRAGCEMLLRLVKRRRSLGHGSSRTVMSRTATRTRHAGGFLDRPRARSYAEIRRR